MIFVRGIFGGRIALALLGHDVDQHRPDLGVADIFEHFDQRAHVVPVDRTDVIEAELLEQRPAGQPAARIFLDLAGPVVNALGHGARDLLSDLARPEIFVRAHQPRERVAHRADRRRDRHVVVVEDDDQPVARRLGIVHRLIGHAGAERPVADHRDRFARRAGQLAGDGEAQRRGDRGRAMRRAERVVFALAAPGEAAEAPALAKRADAVAAAGDDLVRIGLVADVPHQLVAGRVEHIMDGDRQLDHAEPGAEVPAGHRHGRDRLLAELVGELRELILAQCPDVGWIFDLIEQRRVGPVAHRRRPYPHATGMSPMWPPQRFQRLLRDCSEVGRALWLGRSRCYRVDGDSDADHIGGAQSGHRLQLKRSLKNSIRQRPWMPVEIATASTIVAAEVTGLQSAHPP